MRASTGLALVAIILLFAVLGWQAFKVLGVLLAVFVVVFVLLPIAAFAVAVVLLRRRMRRSLRDLHAAVQRQRAAAADAQRAAQQRRDAIDVEGEVKDGPRP